MLIIYIYTEWFRHVSPCSSAPALWNVITPVGPSSPKAHYDCWLLTRLVTSCTSLQSVLPFKHIINHHGSVLWLVASRSHCRLDKSSLDRSTQYTLHQRALNKIQPSETEINEALDLLPHSSRFSSWRFTETEQWLSEVILHLKWIFSPKDKTGLCCGVAAYEWQNHWAGTKQIWAIISLQVKIGERSGRFMRLEEEWAQLIFCSSEESNSQITSGSRTGFNSTCLHWAVELFQSDVSGGAQWRQIDVTTTTTPYRSVIYSCPLMPQMEVYHKTVPLQFQPYRTFVVTATII